MSGNGKTLGFTTDATQNALSTMYESMKPDVTQMRGLIDDYREAGKAVPQSLMDSFNEAVEVGRRQVILRLHGRITLIRFGRMEAMN